MALPSLQQLGSTDILQRLDATELSILHFRGALDLPPKHIQDELIASFFEWVSPILPVINRTAFLAAYEDVENPPSLLLLQAIFSTVAPNTLPQNKDKGGTARMYFQRAKALYDAGYEQDPVTIVQALVLMSWYYNGPQDGTENGLFYWSKLAIAIAQDNDMHRSSELSHLGLSEKRLLRRIWWTLFTRDRATSAAFGRPAGIFLDHTTVEMVTYDDFIEEDGHVPDQIHVQFFLRYVDLCKVLDLVAFQPIKKKGAPVIGASGRSHREVELKQWLLDLPKEMEWQQSKHEFWAGVLNYTYNTILCQFYGMLPNDLKTDSKDSQTVISEASSSILSIVESFVVYDQLRFTPPSIVYSMIMLLITLKSQFSSTIPILVLQSRRKVKTCLELLGLISVRWPIAQMLREASEIVFSEKRFGEMLDTATHPIRNREEKETSKLLYKRTQLIGKQARPEIMLPKQRNVVRMVLTSQPHDKLACQRHSSTTRPQASPASVDADQVRESMATRERDEWPSHRNPGSLHGLGEMPSPEKEAVEDDEFERLMIPFLELSSWRRGL